MGDVAYFKLTLSFYSLPHELQYFRTPIRALHCERCQLLRNSLKLVSWSREL
uniref:Uncharacterized protein n=1 Tax=Anguilla anguilla TaxID=7936 RepID=A0A0E9RG63_ANGAN